MPVGLLPLVVILPAKRIGLKGLGDRREDAKSHTVPEAWNWGAAAVRKGEVARCFCCLSYSAVRDEAPKPQGDWARQLLSTPMVSPSASRNKIGASRGRGVNKKMGKCSVFRSNGTAVCFAHPCCLIIVFFGLYVLRGIHLRRHSGLIRTVGHLQHHPSRLGLFFFFFPSSQEAHGDIPKCRPVELGIKPHLTQTGRQHRLVPKAPSLASFHRWPRRSRLATSRKLLKTLPKWN